MVEIRDKLKKVAKHINVKDEEEIEKISDEEIENELEKELDDESKI